MNDRLLLDTCAAIWLAEGSDLSASAIEAIENADRIAVSPITAWEVGMLVAKNRISIGTQPQRWFKALCDLPGLDLAEMGSDILIDASYLPGTVHNDPADRILIATARAEGLAILTRDRLILKYAESGNLRALPC